MSRTDADTVETVTTRHALPRVNLLPPEVGEARKLRKLQTSLGAGVALIVVAIGGVYVLASHDATAAQKNLAGVQSQTAKLQASKAQFADVPRTLAAIDTAESARQTAMTDDVQWYRYLNDLSYITPANTWLTQVQLTVGAGTAAATTGTAASPTSTVAGQAASPSSTQIANITFTGVAKSHDDVATWLDALAKEKGWTDPYFTNSSQGLIGSTPTVTFNSTVTVTADALSHRYDRKDS